MPALRSSCAHAWQVFRTQGQRRNDNDPSATGHSFAMADANQRSISCGVSSGDIVYAQYGAHTPNYKRFVLPVAELRCSSDISDDCDLIDSTHVTETIIWPRGPQYASICSRPLYGSSWRQRTGMGLPTRNRRCGPSAELSDDLLHLANNEVGAAELRLGE